MGTTKGATVAEAPGTGTIRAIKESESLLDCSPSHQNTKLKPPLISRVCAWLLLPLFSLPLFSGCSISTEVQQELRVKSSFSAARAASRGSIVTESSGLASTVDLDQFGASDSSLTIAARVELDHGPLSFFIDQVGTSSDGQGSFEGALGGADLPADEYGLETDLVTSRIMIAFPLPNFDPESSRPLDLRILAGLNLTELRVALHSIASPTTFSEIDELAPAPILGVHANYTINPDWNVDAIFTVLPLSEITDYDAKCLDSLVRIGWAPSLDWEVFVGARNHSVELVGEQAGRPTEIDLQLELVEIGVSYNF